MDKERLGALSTTPKKRQKYKEQVKIKSDRS